MRLRWPLLLLAVLLAVPQATASHADDTVPALEGKAPVDRTVAWLEDTQMNEDEGCVDKEGCHHRWTKWITVAVAHAGVDPDAWPTPEAPIADWLRDHSDDLRDEALRECQRDENNSEEDCADLRVYSRVKSILALQAAGEDPRQIPLPGGGERDLVAELLAEHGGTEFGKGKLANDDLWALIALNSVGYEGSEVGDAIERVERAQNADGSLSPGANGFPSVDVTASGIMALAPHDRDTFLERARSYLESQQVEEGEHRACWQLSDIANEANAQSTAWAILALTALGEDPTAWSIDGQHPVECLRTYEGAEGGFRHSEGSRLSIWPTHQALAALSWRPYGTVDGPTTRLEATDRATVGEEHTAQIPGAMLRIADASVEEHAWTPEEPGSRTFHGFTLDPPRPASLVVEIEEAGQTEAGSSSNAGSSASGSEGSTASEAGDRPQAHLSAPTQAERNVSFAVHVNGTPGEAPITGFRLEAPGQAATGWQPAGSFELRLDALGPHTVKAWARDAEGRVSEPATADVELVDAAPRAAITGPEQVNRSQPARFEADAYDPDGNLTSLRWGGPEGQRAEGPAATFAIEEPGPAEIRLEATDEAGNTASTTWTVHARNRPPTNLAVQPTELEANASQVLHANAEDPEDDPLDVAWRLPQQSQPRSWGQQFHLETGPPGARQVHVNVSDSYGGWTSGEITLVVREEPDERDPAPVENLTTSTRSTVDEGPRPVGEAPPATIEIPDRIHANANESRVIHAEARSPTGDVVNVTVALGGPVPVRGTEQATALLPPLPPGEYELSARAADRAGWGPWSNATLVVEPPARADALEASGEPEASPTPLGPALAVLALTLAARRWPA